MKTSRINFKIHSPLAPFDEHLYRLMQIFKVFSLLFTELSLGPFIFWQVFLS